MEQFQMSFSRGYCYLRWYEMAKFGPVELDLVRQHLGPYPYVTDVLKHLGPWAATFYHYYPAVRQVGPGVLHVSYKYGVWTWFNVLKYLKEGDRMQYRIGGDDKDGPGAVVTTSVIESSVLSELLRLGGQSAKSAITEYVSDQMVKPNAELKTMLVNSIIDTIKKKASIRKSTKLIIAYKLTALEMTTLAEEFGELQLEFLNKYPHKHAMAASVRKCEEALILLKSDYYSCKYVPKDYDAAIKDIGGNPRSHFERKRFNIHTCQYINCARAAERATQCMLYLRTKRYTEYGNLLDDDVTRRGLYCRRAPQDCPLKAPKVMFLHSLYSMSGREVADAMDSCSAHTGYGVVMFDPNIIWSESGYIESIGADWNIERGATRADDLIHFFFREDSSFGYTHNLKIYLSLFSTSQFISSRGTVYFVQISDFRCGSAHITFVRNMTDFIPRSTIRHRIWNSFMQDKVQVKYYEYHPAGYPDNFSVRFSYEVLVVSKKIVDLGLSHAYSLSTTKFSVNTIYEFLRSANARTIVNGVDVQVTESIHADDLYKLAHALFIKAFIVRYNSSQMVAVITEAIKEQRTQQTFKHVLWSYFTNAGYLFTSKPVEKSEHDMYPGIRGKLFFWLSQPHLFDISISDAVTFREFETVFNEVSVNYGVADHEKDFINTPEAFTAIDIEDPLLEANIDSEIVASVKQLVNSKGKSAIDSASSVGESNDSNSEHSTIKNDEGQVLETSKVPVVCESGEEVVVPLEEEEKTPSSDTASHPDLDNTVIRNPLPTDVTQPSDMSVENCYDNLPIDSYYLPYSVTTCDADLYVVPMPPDGNCLYHSLIYALSLPLTVPEFKILLLESAALASHSNPAAVTETLSSPGWGDLDVVELVSKHFEIGICVHHIDCSRVYLFRSTTSKPAIHLRFSTDHYDAYTLTGDSDSHISEDPEKTLPNNADMTASGDSESPATPEEDREETPSRTDIQSGNQLREDEKTVETDIERVPSEPVQSDDSSQPPSEVDTVVAPSPVPTAHPSETQCSLEQSKKKSYLENFLASPFVASIVQRPVVRAPLIALIDTTVATADVINHPVESAVSAALVVKEVLTPDPTLDEVDARPIKKVFNHIIHPVNTTAKTLSIARDVSGAVVSTSVNLVDALTYPARHPVAVATTVTAFAIDRADDVVEKVLDPVKTATDMINTISEVKESTTEAFNNTVEKLVDFKRNMLNATVAPLMNNPRANNPSIDNVIVKDKTGIHFPRATISAKGVQVRKTLRGDALDKKIAKLRTNRVVPPPASPVEKFDQAVNNLKSKPVKSTIVSKQLPEVKSSSTVTFMSPPVSRKHPPLVSSPSVNRSDNPVPCFATDHDIDAVSSVSSFRYQPTSPISFVKSSSDDEEDKPSETFLDFSLLPSVSFSPDLTPFINYLPGTTCPPYVEISCSVVDKISVSPYIEKVDRPVVYFQLRKYEENISFINAFKQLAANPNPCVYVLFNPIEKLNFKEDTFQQISKFIQDSANQRIRLIVVCNINKPDYDKMKTLSRPISSTLNYENKSMYEAWNGSGHNYSHYKPVRKDPTTPINVAKNAMYEQREYWRIKEHIIIETYSKVYKQLTSSALTKDQARKVASGAEGYGLLSGKGVWQLKPNFPRRYECVFDGVNLIPYSEYTNGAKLANPLVLVGNSLELMQDNKLYNATLSIDVESYEGVEIENRQGVPGCGKTYNFLHTCRPPVSGNVGDLVLFPTREGAIEFRGRIRQMHPQLSDDQLKTYYRTMDSYLLHADATQYPVVMIDEALMVHAGQLLFCVMKAGAKKLIMIGDDKQIKFINRVPQCEIIYSDPLKFTTANVHLSVTRRCTLTVAALLSPYYEQGMKSTSQITGEMRLERYINIGKIVKKDDHQYIVFKQTEKSEMIKYGFTNTKTIHEYQGKQADHIVLVRTTTKKEDIYNQFSHSLVAISRHRVSFTYITPVDDDAVAKFVQQSKKINLFNSKQFFHDPTIDKLPGGGVPVVSTISVETAENFRYHENIYSCVEKYGYPDIPTFSVQSVLERPLQLEQRPFVAVNEENCDYQVIQEFYDHVFPGNSLHVLKFDSHFVLHSDLAIYLENTSFNPAYRAKTKTSEFDKMRTTLRTACPPSRPNNQIESLLAMVKRNQAVPDLAGVKDDETLSVTMVDRFIQSYLVRGAKSLCEQYRKNPIRPNSTIISQWLDTQPTGTIDNIEQENHISMTTLTQYDFMIKSTVKPQLDTNAPYVYSALQTIAYQGKNVNVIFCPIFKQLKKRIISLMKTRFMINCDVSPEEFQMALFDKLGPKAFQGKNFLEIDMSKYDKSQGKIMLLFECRLMELFGVDRELVKLWYNAHLQTTLKDRTNKIRCKVNYQRKSGDASTFIGNTFFLMGVVAMLFDLEQVSFGVFAGDDSLLVGGHAVDVDLNSACAALFNLESKFLRSYKYPYFCSKFLVADEYGYALVPDPLKLVTKLGRSDLVNTDHVEQYRISLCDIVKSYRNLLIHPYISKAINERYRTNGCHSAALTAVYSIIHNKEKFHELYFTNPEDNICLDPSLPSFD